MYYRQDKGRKEGRKDGGGGGGECVCVWGGGGLLECRTVTMLMCNMG